MKLRRVRVENFRSLKDVEVDCEELTALVGANGIGKSNILKAVKLFHDQSSIEKEDYYGLDTGNKVSVELAFDGIEDEDRFGAYMNGGEMVIRRVFDWNEGKVRSSYQVRIMQHGKFRGIRDSQAKPAKEEYNRLVGEGYDLSKWNSHDKAKEAIKVWEEEHPDRCEPGYVNCDLRELQKGSDPIMRVIFVPAVRDAADEASDAQNSSLAQLMREVVGEIEEDEEYKKFKADAEGRYGELMGKFAKNQLKVLSSQIDGELGDLVEGVEVQLSWQDADLRIGLPHTTAKLKEKGNLTTVDRSGHGSQRALIMAMLQYLEKRAEPDAGGERPAVMLLIEEPELYQHPTRQRLLARVFGSLTAKGRMQIMYATHSPHFVGIDRIDHVRLLRKCKDRTGYHTEISRTGIRDMYHKLQELGEKDDEQSLPERLSVIMTPWINEGFFADLIVLVEGQSDYAAITAASKLAGEDLEKSGISIIPCGGKTNMLPLLAMFQSLKIPCYPVWDSDDKDKTDRRLNGKIWKEAGSDMQGSRITGAGACIEKNLEEMLEREIGKEVLDELITNAQKRYHISDRSKILTKTKIVLHLLEDAKAADHSCESLSTIVEHIKQKSRASA